MNKVILQPSGNKDAREHFHNTIQSPVPIETLKKFLSEDDFSKLLDLYIDAKHIPTWGVTPGKNDVNKTKWMKIESGDVSLFSANGKIFASGVVTLKIHNKELAEFLWGYNLDGHTWEYIYFLDEVTRQDISYPEFNLLAGYKDNNVIQGFSVLDESKSEAVILELKLGSELHSPEVSFEEYKRALKQFDNSKPLDVARITLARTEQNFLRNQLFGKKKIHRCAFCERELPINLLVAAHIKKRSKCSKDEKEDFQNNVLPLCKFGCDDLFERGYLIVEEGIIKKGVKTVTRDLDIHIEKIIGSRCSHWSNSSIKYYNWHSDFHKSINNTQLHLV